MSDGLSSTRQLANTQGALTDSYAYDAWGKDTGTVGSTPNAFRFNGQQLDNTGLYFLRARYMNPSTGRFLSQDPLMGSSDDPASLHRYLYVKNSPVNGVDPSGRDGDFGSQMEANAIYTEEQGQISGAGGLAINYSERTAIGWAAQNQQTIARLLLAAHVPIIAFPIVEALYPGQPGGPPASLDDGGDPDDPYVHLVHGTTAKRAESLMKNGPSLDISKDFNDDSVTSFSLAPATAAGIHYARDYAQKKANIFGCEDEGGPVLLHIRIPRSIAKLAFRSHGNTGDSESEYLFAEHVGFDQLKANWHSFDKFLETDGFEGAEAKPEENWWEDPEYDAEE